MSYDSINIYQIWNSVFNRVIWTRNIIFDKKTIFNDNIEAARLEFKKTQTAQNMNFNQLIEFLQWLNNMKTTKQLKSDRLNLNDNDNIMISESDNTDLNNHDLNSHDSDENQLWNEELLKNYTLKVMNLLKLSYSTFLKILSILLTVVIYQIFNKHDEDSHNTDFEFWKTVFTAGRLVQSEKIQQSCCQIKEKDSIIKEKIELVMKIQQELKLFHWKQLSSESKSYWDLEIHSLENLFKQTEINHFRSHAQINFWSEIEKKNSIVKKQQVLDCM